MKINTNQPFDPYFLWWAVMLFSFFATWLLIMFSGCAGTKASLSAEGHADQYKPATAVAKAELTWSR